MNDLIQLLLEYANEQELMNLGQNLGILSDNALSLADCCQKNLQELLGYLER